MVVRQVVRRQQKTLFEGWHTMFASALKRSGTHTNNIRHKSNLSSANWLAPQRGVSRLPFNRHTHLSASAPAAPFFFSPAPPPAAKKNVASNGHKLHVGGDASSLFICYSRWYPWTNILVLPQPCGEHVRLVTQVTVSACDAASYTW